MLLTIKCDMPELVCAQSKDKEISCKLPKLYPGLFHFKSKISGKNGDTSTAALCNSQKISLVLQGDKNSVINVCIKD